MSQNWNQQFTQLLRDTHPSYWGNWTLDGTILPGAVGTIDPGTGSFIYLSTLPNQTISPTNTVASDWKIQSSSVTETQANVDFNGTVVDPDTGEKITAGLKMTWSFGQQGDISSTFTLQQQESLEDFAMQMISNLDWLKQQAQSVNMLANGTIAQGFGVVTSVLYASSGLNLGSQSNSSSFSIEGSVSGVNAMAGDSSIGAKGSYANTTQTAAFESHLWPSATNQLPGDPVVIAFEFASFYGDQVFQGWVTNVSDILVSLENNHGGTYIVNATAKYVYNGQQQSVSASVSGGLTTTMPPIPPLATNLQLNLSFKGFHDTLHSFNWVSPIAQFPNGQIIIDLYGVWPGKTSAVERQTGETG